MKSAIKNLLAKIELLKEAMATHPELLEKARGSRVTDADIANLFMLTSAKATKAEKDNALRRLNMTDPSAPKKSAVRNIGPDIDKHTENLRHAIKNNDKDKAAKALQSLLSLPGMDTKSVDKIHQEVLGNLKSPLEQQADALSANLPQQLKQQVDEMRQPKKDAAPRKTEMREKNAAMLEEFYQKKEAAKIARNQGKQATKSPAAQPVSQPVAPSNPQPSSQDVQADANKEVVSGHPHSVAQKLFGIDDQKWSEMPEEHKNKLADHLLNKMTPAHHGVNDGHFASLASHEKVDLFNKFAEHKLREKGLAFKPHVKTE